MTIAEILIWAEISEPLSTISIQRKGLFGGGTPNYLPTLIRQTRQVIQRKYTQDPSDENLTGNAYYLYALCGIYAQQAKNISGTGGSVAPINPGSEGLYPFFIYSNNFESDGVSYNNEDILGDNITLFINEYSQQWILSGAETFSYTSTGIIINLAGFDATTQSYTIMVQKINNP